jgi:hypothetical protein
MTTLFTTARPTALLGVLCFAALFSGSAFSQSSKSGSCSAEASGCSYGYYTWQVDEGTVTTTLTPEIGFNSAPGTVTIGVSIPSKTTIHEFHGNAQLDVGSASSECDIIAKVLDQSSNVIATVALQEFGGSVNIPIKGTIASSSGLSITALQLQFYNGSCGGTVTFGWGLVLS